MDAEKSQTVYAVSGASALAEQCSACETLGSIIDPQAMLQQIPSIRSDVQELLAGLGFS